MAEQDDAERRDLLKKAHAVLEEDFKRLEAAKRVVQEEIAARKKELRDLDELIDGAKLQRDRDLEAMRQEQSVEAAALASKSESLRLELATMHGRRNQAETEASKAMAELDALIAGRREHLAKLNGAIAEQEARLSAAKTGLASLKSSLGAIPA